MKQFAVASFLVMPNAILRPPAPGQTFVDAQKAVAGRPSLAVARTAVKPIHAMRPPAPGQPRGDAQVITAGRILPSIAVA